MNFSFSHGRRLLAFFAATFMGIGSVQAATLVDVELQLLVDVSGSIDSNEFSLQQQGYAQAFRSAGVQAGILGNTDGRIGSIAAELVFWSSGSEQAVVVPWRLLDSKAAIDSFADEIAAAPRTFFGSTAPGSALDFGSKRFATNDFDSRSKVIDISSDGIENSGINTAGARDAAIAAGVDRINGLAIGGSFIGEYLKANAVAGKDGITGVDAFVLLTDDFADIESAVTRKLVADISGTSPQPIPLPATAWLLIAGVGSLVAVRRRRGSVVA